MSCLGSSSGVCVRGTAEGVRGAQHTQCEAPEGPRRRPRAWACRWAAGGRPEGQERRAPVTARPPATVGEHPRVYIADRDRRFGGSRPGPASQTGFISHAICALFMCVSLRRFAFIFLDLSCFCSVFAATARLVFQALQVGRRAGDRGTVGRGPVSPATRDLPRMKPAARGPRRSPASAQPALLPLFRHPCPSRPSTRSRAPGLVAPPPQRAGPHTGT